MSDGQVRDHLRIDRRQVLISCLLPAIATIIAMLGGFLIVAGVLMVWETAIVGHLVTRMVALGIMYLLPPFVVGLRVGRKRGPKVVPPIVIGITPILALVVALVLFDGPIWAPFERPLLVLGAVVIWTGIAGIGVFLGATWTRVEEERDGHARATRPKYGGSE